MFDVGFSEIVLIGIVALVVFGPEDLPRVARTAGHLLGKFRRYVADVKSDIHREMEAADLKGLVDEVQDSARSLQDSVNEQARALQAEFHHSIGNVQQDVAAVSAEAEQVLQAPEMHTPDLFGQVEPTIEAVPSADENQLDLFGTPAASVKTVKG